MRVFCNGRKLKGGWTLHRTRGEGTKSQWLFMKRRDGLAAALEALNTQTDTARVWADGYELRLTSLNKVFWPPYADRRALLKRHPSRYYLQIAPFVLPHLRDRPVTMTRYPNGINGKKSYQTSPKESAPPVVGRFVAFSERNTAADEYFVCNNAATLIWLAQFGDLELHVTHTRTNRPDASHLEETFDGSLKRIQRSTLNYPAFLVIDLHPYLYSGKQAPQAEAELHAEGSPEPANSRTGFASCSRVLD